MTESEFAVAADPRPMLKRMRGWISSRRLRLYGCACCRRIWNWIPEGRYRNCIEVAERFADGDADEEARQAAFQAAVRRVPDGENEPWETRSAQLAACWIINANDVTVERVGFEAAKQLGDNVAKSASSKRWKIARNAELAIQTSILRCIVGNPFRPVALDPAWRTANVLALARTIYEERAFERLPILADALMDAGCTDEDILKHCRSEVPHVRGCWVVDLILGKE